MRKQTELNSKKRMHSNDRIEIPDNHIEKITNSKMIMENLEHAEEFLIKAYVISSFTDKRIPLKKFLNEFEEKLIDLVLRVTKGSLSRAAQILNVKKTTLGEKMKKYGMEKLEYYVNSSHINSFEEILSFFQNEDIQTKEDTPWRH